MEIEIERRLGHREKHRERGDGIERERNRKRGKTVNNASIEHKKSKS